MVRTIVKGEIHSSRKDKEALVQMDLSQFDAVFQEGYEKSGAEARLSAGLALFRIGRLVMKTTIGRIYYDREDVKEWVRESRTPFHDEIDAPISEHYRLVPRWKRILMLAFSPVVALVVPGLVVGVVQSIAPVLIISEIRLAVGLVLAFVLGFLWAMFYFMMVAGEAFEIRDDIMSESIIDTVESQGYSTVLVSCGEKHREGIAGDLREEGWEVEERATSSSLGKLFIIAENFTANIVGLVGTLKNWND